MPIGPSSGDQISRGPRKGPRRRISGGAAELETMAAAFGIRIGPTTPSSGGQTGRTVLAGVRGPSVGRGRDSTEREVVAMLNRLLHWVASALGRWGPVALRREMDDG
jgi:hypothetical protein